MTLFIACLLIYGLNLNPWLYVIATGLWVGKTAFELKQKAYFESLLR